MSDNPLIGGLTPAEIVRLVGGGSLAFATPDMFTHPGELLPSYPIPEIGNRGTWINAWQTAGGSLGTLEQTASTNQTQQETVAGSGTVLPILFGERWIGARVFAVGVIHGVWNGLDPYAVVSDALVLGLAWCLGPCESITEIRVNDQLPHAAIDVSHHYGTASQTVDNTFQQAFGNTFTDRLNDPPVCYSAVYVPPGMCSGFPRFTAKVKGIKLPTTDGGAPEWTDNPAYLLAALIENAQWGLGKTVNWTSVAAVAAACDATVGGERKRILNLRLDSAQETTAWIETVRDYAGCFVVPDGAGYRLIPDAPAESVLSIGDADIVDKSFRYAVRSARSAPTAVEVTYTDTSSYPWRDRVAPMVQAASVAAGGPLRNSPVPKPGITRYSEANRYAIERLNDFTLNNFSAQCTVFEQGLKLQGGEVITLTYTPKGISSKLMRVIAVPQPVSPGRWSLSLQEYDPAKYSSAVESVPTYPDTTLDDPARPYTPAAVTAEEEVYQQQSNGAWLSRIRAAWDKGFINNGVAVDAYTALDHYLVVVSNGEQVVETGVVARSMQSADGTFEYVTAPLAENVTYTVNVYAVSTIGAKGSASSASVTLDGKLSLPSNVPSITGSEAGGEVRLHWISATDLDLTGHELRYSATGGSWASATLLDRVAAPGVRYSTKAVPAGTWRFWVKGLDSVRTETYPYGQESATATYCDVTVTEDVFVQMGAPHPFTSPTLDNMTEYTVGGVTYIVTDNDDGVGYGTLNTDNTVGTFNDGSGDAQVTYPMGIPTSASTSSCTTEAWNYGSVVTGTASTALAVTNLAGTAVIEIGYSTDDSTYVWTPASSARGSGQYWKLRVSTSGNGVVQFDKAALQLTLSIVLREESGTLSVASTGLSTVYLRVPYSAAASVQVTPVTSDARSVTADRVLVNPFGTGAQFACTHTFVSNSYSYLCLVDDSGGGGYVVQAGDYLEYDVLAFPTCPTLAGVGGVEFQFTDDDNLRGDGACVDAFGQNNGPILTGWGGRWAHRKIPIATKAGKTVKYVFIDVEADTSGTYGGLVQNILVTNGGTPPTVRKTYYMYGAVSLLSPTFSSESSARQLQTGNAFDVYVYDAAGARQAAQVYYTFKGA